MKTHRRVVSVTAEADLSPNFHPAMGGVPG